MVKFTVYGEPKAKGRPRVSVRKSADGEKTFARAYTPKNTVMYENQVKAEYGVQCDKAFYDPHFIQPFTQSVRENRFCYIASITTTKFPGLVRIIQSP